MASRFSLPVGDPTSDRELFETYIRAPEALTKLARVLGSKTDAIEVLARRLSAKQILAAARIVFNRKKNTTQEIASIPNYWWQFGGSIFSFNDTFWRSGDMDIEIPTKTGYDVRDSYSLFDVRFDPEGMAALLPSSPPNEAAEPSGESRPLTPVSDAALRAFYALYLEVTPLHKRTDDELLRYFRQCLPGRQLSRERMRSLRGEAKRGRKSAGGES
jgi:hypothetical protein